MGLPITVVLSFVWNYVIPVLKDCIKVVNKGVYGHIKDRVDDADVKELHGIEKRMLVYDSAVNYLEQEGVDPSLYSSTLIYLLIEIAVANLRRKQKRLVKNGG